MSSNRIAPIAAVVVIAAVAAGMILFELSFSEISPGKLLKDGTLTNAQTKAIEITLSLFALLNTWSLAVIGATGFFLKLNVEKGIRLRRIDLVVSFAIVIISITSLFFGHLAIDRTATLLSLEIFPMADGDLRQIARCQYLTGLGGLALFGFHVVQFFWARLDPPAGERTEGTGNVAKNPA